MTPSRIPAHRKAPRRLSQDHLTRNALFLLISTGSMGAFGFVFWIVAAHLYSTVSIGRAATVISAMSVISYLSDLGLASTLIRVLPTSQDADAEINTALILTSALAVVIATAYVLVVPLFVPNVEFLRANPLHAIGFVVLNACVAANLLTDSVFIAYRRTQFNVVVDGLMQGVAKLACLGAFVGLPGECLLDVEPPATGDDISAAAMGRRALRTSASVPLWPTTSSSYL